MNPSRIPWLHSVITGPRIGKSDQIACSPQLPIITVIGSGKSLKAWISSTSLVCPGCLQGICCATEMTTSHNSQRKLSGPSLSSFSFSFGRLSGKSLSISCAAFAGESVALGWRYVFRIWKSLSLMIHGSLFGLSRTRLRGVESAMMVVSGNKYRSGVYDIAYLFSYQTSSCWLGLGRSLRCLNNLEEEINMQPEVPLDTLFNKTSTWVV